MTAEEYRQKLRTLRSQIASRSDHLADAIREEVLPPGNQSAAPVHMADHISSTVDADAEILETERGLLAQIDAAIDRLNAGSFGKCTSCGRPISAERLAALPYAATCKDCAQRDESLSPDDVHED